MPGIHELEAELLERQRARGELLRRAAVAALLTERDGQAPEPAAVDRAMGKPQTLAIPPRMVLTPAETRQVLGLPARPDPFGWRRITGRD